MGKMKELDILTSRDEDDIITDDEQGVCNTCEFIAEMIEANIIDRKDIEDWYCKECEDKRKRAISTAAPRGWRVAG